MNAIKSLLAVSVLVGAGAANAAIWDVNASGKQVNPEGGGDIFFTMVGTWNDATNAGSWGVTIDPPALEGVGDGLIHITTQNFTMDEVNGKGLLSQAAGGLNCTDPLGGPGCAGTLPGFKGSLQNGATNTPAWAPVLTPTPTTPAVGFVPSNGLTTSWLLRIATAVAPVIDPETDEVITAGYTVYTYNPLSVTLSQVPVPAAAWLFGSALLGLAGTARRRRAA